MNYSNPSTDCDSEPFAAPQRATAIREFRAAFEPLRLALHTPRLRRTPRGNGDPAIVFPGFGAGDDSTFLLRSYLRTRGHETRGWGLGRNSGDPAAVIDRCVELLTTVASAERPANVIGWSLGGVLARELARDHPHLVRCVVTLATPLHGPRPSAVASRYSEAKLQEIENEIAERSRRPIVRPVLAFHTRSDGVVDWRACLDRGANAINIESNSTHLGIALDPDVWRRTAEFLALPHPLYAR